MSRFYLVTLDPVSDVTQEMVEDRLNMAEDWFRYRRFDWIIYDDEDASFWYDELEEFAKPDGSVLIVALDPIDRAGWMSKKFWRWMRQYV